MQLTKLALIALFFSYVAAQDIDDNDVPVECRGVCASVVTLTTTCDRQNNDDDSGFINCVCTAPNAASEIAICEACVANFDRNDGHDNDVNDFIRSCSFTTTPYTSTGTGLASTASPTTTGGALTTLTGSSSSSTPVITGAASSVRESLSSALSSASASNSGTVASLGSRLSSVSSAAASATATGNLAAVNGMPAVGVLGAVVLGLAGFI